MSAEGTPHENISLLGRLLVWITWISIQFPIVTVAIGVLAAVVSLYLSQTRLAFRTSRADLLNPKSEFTRLWCDYTKEFGETEDVVVLVESDSQEKVVPVLEDVAAALLRETQLWNSVLHKIDLTKIHSKGLYYLKPEKLAGIEQFLDKFAPLIRGDWSQMNLGNMSAEMGKMLQYLTAGQPQNPQLQAQRALIEKEIVGFFDSLMVSLREPGKYQSPWDGMSSQLGQDQQTVQYLLAKNGRIGFIQLRLAVCDKASFTGSKAAIDSLRQLVIQARTRHPGILIGLTGLPIIENDEMTSSESSIAIATLLSVVGVFVVVWLGFGGLCHSILPMVALFLGTIWSLGYIVLTIGHINILSSAFGAILTGIGIDYGTYMTARYLELRKANKLVEESLLQMAGTILPGITVGMTATALSFFMAGFTEFVGVAELGFITGGGVLLCWLACITVLPALICLTDKNSDRILPQPLELHHLLTPICAHPWTVLGIGLAGTIVLSVGINRVWYDHNLMHMQAEGLESVALEQKILSEGDQSACFAISIADDAQTLLERKKRFLQLPSVKNIFEIDSILIKGDSMTAPDMAAKKTVIERINRRLVSLPQQAPQIPLPSMAEIGQLFAKAQAMSSGGSQGNYLQQRLQQVGILLQQLPQAEFYSRLAEFQQSMARDVLTRLYALRAVSNPETPRIGDLPDSLVKRFVSPSGKHLMRIYAKGDIWNMDSMKQFVNELRTIDKSVTGNPVQIYEASLQMKRSYEQATWLALCTILPVMFFTLGSLRDALLAVCPLGLCMLQMFGIMGFLDIPLNPANMISLPLMLGMGVDNGINIIHDFHNQRGKYRMSPSTAVAVILNTLTTMVGFAVLMIADHRGLQSMGRILTIGMSCCLVTSLIMLPPFLAWLTRNRREEKLYEPEADEHFETDQHPEYPDDEEPNEEEFLRFPPRLPVDGEQAWTRKRSA